MRERVINSVSGVHTFPAVGCSVTGRCISSSELSNVSALSDCISSVLVTAFVSNGLSLQCK